MTDLLKLEYILKKNRISKDALTEAEGWSSATCYRKMNGDSDWTIAEVNVLVTLGIGLSDILEIFFN